MGGILHYRSKLKHFLKVVNFMTGQATGLVTIVTDLRAVEHLWNN